MEAAPTLSRCQKMNTLSSKVKKATTKTVLCSPYNTKWPVVDGTSQKNILEKMKKYWSTPVSTKDPSVVVGLQNVTRCLERDVIQLIVVDRSAPLQLHRHLIQLSAVRGCAAVAVDSLATTLCPALNVSRLCVLGFKKGLTSVNETGTRLQDVIDDIIRQCPPVVLPWLDFQRPLIAIKENNSPDLAGVTSELGDVTDVAADTSTSSEGVPVTEGVPATGNNSETIIDYSHLYIFKSDVASKTSPSMPGNVNFISLPASDDEDDDDNDDSCAVLPMRASRGAPFSADKSRNSASLSAERSCTSAPISADRSRSSIAAATSQQSSNSERKRVAVGEPSNSEKYVRLNVGKLQNNLNKKKKKKKNIKNGGSGDGL